MMSLLEIALDETVPLKRRITLAMHYKDVTAEKIAIEAGCDPTYVSKILAGYQPKKESEKFESVKKAINKLTGIEFFKFESESISETIHVN